VTQEHVTVEIDAHFRGVYRLPALPLPLLTVEYPMRFLLQADATVVEKVLDNICGFAITKPLDIR